MDISDDASNMDPEEALQYLHEFIDIPPVVLMDGLVAYRWTRVLGRALVQARVSLSGNQMLTFILMAMAIPPERVMAGILELKRLERALMALGMPHDEVHASFLRYSGNNHQDFPPLYETYMISAGRAQEIITDHWLAQYLAIQIDDARSLNRYRRVHRIYARVGIRKEPINRVGDRVRDLFNRRLLGSGTRLAATHKWLLEKRAYAICFGVALFNMFLGYDPNEERGAPISDVYRTYSTLLTLTECLFSVLEHFGVEDCRWKLATFAMGIATLRLISLLSTILLEAQGCLLQHGGS